MMGNNSDTPAFALGDGVLVPGEVTGYDSEGYYVVTFPGGEFEFRPEDLRPDTGRPITAQDVRDALRSIGVLHLGSDVEAVADRLNRIARGAPERGGESGPGCACGFPDAPLRHRPTGSGRTCDEHGIPERGDDEPRSGNGGNAGACPACAGGEPHEPWTDEDAENVETALRAADADRAGHWPTVAGWLACEVRRLRAGSLPAMPPEVTEALDWFREVPRKIVELEEYDADNLTMEHAATVVRWVMSLSNGHSDTGEPKASAPRCASSAERAASERDEPHPLYPHLPARPRGAVDAALDMLFRLASDGEADDVLRQARGELEHLIPFGLIPADPSPRSWSLPAPPPDDVTVVHLRGDGMRCERKREYWVNPYGGELTWGELFSDGFTVVEGEPPAPEPQEPPRFGPEDNSLREFERGFYRLARDLDTEDLVIKSDRHIVIGDTPNADGSLRVGLVDSMCVTSASATALAAAGAERVEEES